MQRIRFNAARNILESIVVLIFAVRIAWYIISSFFHIFGTVLGRFMLIVRKGGDDPPLEAHIPSKLTTKPGERSGRHPSYSQKSDENRGSEE